MTNRQILAMNEYMKEESVPAFEIMQKYNLTPSQFWSAYAQLKAKAPK